MKINHVIPSLSASSGGPARSVPLVCHALSQYADIEISTIQSDDQVSVPNSVTVHAFAQTLHSPLRASKGLRQHLLTADYDVLNAHGLWQLPTHYAVKSALSREKPLVITPRGMLEPGALQFSHWKKHLSGWLWQNRDLHRATCIHATSQMEADNCRRYGLKNPIAVVPNGIDLSEYPLKQEGRTFLSDHSSGEKRQLLFLSRIHPKKGLCHLLEAWAQLPHVHGEWQLVIAGSDDGGHEDELKKMATDLQLDWSDCVDNPQRQVSIIGSHLSTSSLHFPGALFGDDKLRAYQEAELFVLPTLSENFGMVIPEALACGTPVITTKGAPWSELETTGSGWWIDVGTDPLKDCLEQALRCSSEELRQMGAGGRKLVEEHYSIDSVAQQMMSIYEWCISSGMPPSCLQRVEGEAL